MGYYIQTEQHFNKADVIMKTYGAEEITLLEARSIVDNPDTAVVCVIKNDLFEAAGFCYNGQELEAFALPHDHRPKRWLKMDRQRCKELTGYKGS